MTGRCFIHRVKVAPARYGTLDPAAIPGQKLVSHAPFARGKPLHQESRLADPRDAWGSRVPGVRACSLIPGSVWGAVPAACSSVD